ncbi:hypothetical protein [Streptomyces sp. NPDC007369]|uniref:hypothetical protein n=1 Tax=Streptomyces sp. NPDC007369 TaxID=3154589 RepID=UPI0033C85DA5
MTITFKRGAAVLGALLLGLILAATVHQHAGAAEDTKAAADVEYLWSLEGDEQSVAAGQQVPVRLKVVAVDKDLKPVQGASVTFSTPGPGLKFPGDKDDATVVTDENGEALAPDLRAAGEPGPDLVTASVPSDVHTAFEITIT